jgi:hypothetical protein
MEHCDHGLFYGITRNFLRETERNHEKQFVGYIDSSLAEIRTENLLNECLESQCSTCLFGSFLQGRHFR